MRDEQDALALAPGDETARAAPAPAGAGRRGLAVMAAAVALVAAVVAGAIWLRPQPAPEPQPPVHFTLHAPVAAVNGTVFLSPQGDRLAYVAPGGSGVSQIWIRSLDDPEPDADAALEDRDVPLPPLRRGDRWRGCLAFQQKDGVAGKRTDLH